jgi:hypothetical protein
MGNELDLYRARAEAISVEVELEHVFEFPPAYPSMVGQVFAITAVPTTADVFVAIHPVDVLGAETEGGAGTLVVNTAVTVFSYIIGVPPAAGDFVLARWMGNRWAAERWGTGGSIIIIVPGCPCASQPATITMTSSKPLSNNQIFQNATLQYGPTPGPLLPVVLTSSSYLSTTSFPDPILSVPFYYFLTCSLGAYVLTRVYVTSPFGSPFRDSIRYKWIPGFPGNTCSPFLMTNGQIFAGGDASCIVTLSM